MINRIRRTVSQNLRAWAAVATVSWGLTLAMYGCQRFFDPLDSYSDGGASGPYAVHAMPTVAPDRPIFVIERPVDQVAPGTMVGWSSSLCVQHGHYLLVRPTIVRLKDGARIAIGSDKLWTPQDHRCGGIVGAMLVPSEADPGEYEVRREVWANPLGWFPQHATLTGVRFHIGETTKRTP